MSRVFFHELSFEALAASAAEIVVATPAAPPVYEALRFPRLASGYAYSRQSFRVRAWVRGGERRPADETIEVVSLRHDDLRVFLDYHARGLSRSWRSEVYRSSVADPNHADALLLFLRRVEYWQAGAKGETLERRLGGYGWVVPGAFEAPEREPQLAGEAPGIARLEVTIGLPAPDPVAEDVVLDAIGDAHAGESWSGSFVYYRASRGRTEPGG